MILDTSKPIFLLSQGKSVERLNEYIEEYKDLDVYWTSFNYFHNVEEIIMKERLHINILYLLNEYKLSLTRKNVIRFLSLGGERVCIVNISQNILDKNVYLKWKHNTKVLYVSDTISFGTPLHFVRSLIDIGFKNFFIFGLDMNYKKINHYKEETYPYFYSDEIRSNMLAADVMSAHMHYKEWFPEKDINIFNCNPDSELLCFEKISYNQVKEKYEKCINNRNNR